MTGYADFMTIEPLGLQCSIYVVWKLTEEPDGHLVYLYTYEIRGTFISLYAPVQVNLCTGVPVGGAMETCTAGAGSLSVEFTLLSRLVGDPTYEKLARRSVRALWDKRHPTTGLVGELGQWEGRVEAWYEARERGRDTHILYIPLDFLHSTSVF